MTPAEQSQFLAKLAAAWAVSPTLTLGQLIESVENVAWDLVGNRHVSMRLMHLPDHVLGAALDQWTNAPAARKPLYQ